MTGTFDAEDDLPRVPVPALADSAAQFLEWCDPLLDDDQRAQTRAAVDQLLRPDGPGPVLQAALEAFDAEPTTHTWLDDFWESRYLGRRDRIALNANFFFLFTDSADPAESDQAARAAGLVLGALDHKHRVDTETLPPATRKGAPMTMEQHKYLFSATRIPGDGQDTARTPYTDAWPGPSRERHIVVFVRGHAFRMDVLGADGTAHTAAEIADGLRAIRARVGDTRGPGVGHLTTKARAEWAASRRALLAEGNEAALDDLERALFCVSLEDEAPGDDRATGAQLLHGDSANRWFDKAVTFVVFPDGTAGINTEHCRLDGTTVLALVDGMLDASTAEHADALGARSQGVPDASPLPFAITEERAEDIRAAGEDFARVRGVRGDPAGGLRRPRQRPRQEARRLAGLAGADGLPARPRAVEGLRGRHLRVDRHAGLPPRPHRGHARRDARRSSRSRPRWTTRPPTTTPAGRRSRRPRAPTSGAPRRARRATRPSSTSGSSR